MYVDTAIFAVLSYLLGAVPFGLLVGLSRGIDIRKVREFLVETIGLVGHLPAAVRDDMREAVAEAQAEAGNPSPDAGKVGKALAVIKDLGMRAGGSMIATGIVEGVKALAP